MGMCIGYNMPDAKHQHPHKEGMCIACELKPALPSGYCSKICAMYHRKIQ